MIENFKSFKLNHGIMETGYANHQSATLNATASNSGPVYNAQDLSVSMTATIDVSGNLVLGKLFPVVELFNPPVFHPLSEPVCLTQFSYMWVAPTSIALLLPL